MALTQTLMALVVVGGTAASMALGSQPASSSIGQVRVAAAGIDMIVTGPVPSVGSKQATGIACDAACQNQRLSYWRNRLQN